MNPRVDQDLTEIKGRLDSLQVQINKLFELAEAAGKTSDAHGHKIVDLESQIASHIGGMFAGLADQVDALTAKVEGRNKSAPTKRNMTDADAMRALQGDMKELNHKEAAIAMGLTYAQVYSCRGGFTFKHVIHDLEKTGWKNPWEKSTTIHKK